MHAKLLFKWVGMVLCLFWAVSYVGTAAAREVVARSGFRLAIAAMGSPELAGRPIQVAIGNSQLMDGLNADQINASRRDVRFLNLAFNGLESPDVVAVLETFYKNCTCTIDRLYINEGALKDETPGTSDVELFMSAFNRDLMSQILQDRPSMRYPLLAMPLLHFNDEVFHRSAYYWLRGKDDQGHGNDYHLKIPKIAPGRLGGVQKQALIDMPRVNALIAVTREHQTEMVVVVPPFHPLYVDNRVGFRAYVDEVRTVLARVNLPVLDHSQGVVTRPDGYADLIHLNLEGQETYSRYFSEHVIPAPEPLRRTAAR